MKNSKKMFLLIEVVLGGMVIVLASLMIREKNGKELDKVSVIIENSDDNQWTAFQYGLKMAAEDHGIELLVVSTGEKLTQEEQKNLIDQEISRGADGIILQPVSGRDSEKMLKKVEKRVPVMLVEYPASKGGETSRFPVTQPDHYAMGAALAEELLKDYNGNLTGKTLGIFAETMESEAVEGRIKGFTETLEGTGAKVLWTVSEELEMQKKVDFIIALDDSSLVHVGEATAANNLHGSLVYGIGRSTEAVYYLDIGSAVCLVVPDEFNMGYQSLTEMSKRLERSLHNMESKTVSYMVLRRDTLFSKENQELLFTMSQ